jgi:hypothetical protein
MAAKSGRNPQQKPSRVSRLPGNPTVKAPGRTAPPPMNAAADRQENLRRGPGPTKAGPNTPAPSSAAVTAPAAIRDLTSPGTTIASRANLTGRRRKAAG